MGESTKQLDGVVIMNKKLLEKVLQNLSDNSVSKDDLRKSFYDVLSMHTGVDEKLFFNLGKLAFHADLPNEALTIINELNMMGYMDSGTILAMVGRQQYDGSLKREYQHMIELCESRGHFRARSALAEEKFRWLGPLRWFGVIPYRTWILLSALALWLYSPHDPRVNVSVALFNRCK